MVQKLLKIVSLASLLVHTVCNYLGSANLATSNLSPPFVVGLRTRRPSWSRLENGPSTIILDDCLICNSFVSSCNRLVLLVLAGSCCIPNIVVFFFATCCDSLEKWQRVTRCRQVTLGTTTLVSKPWRSRIFSVCTERVWKGHSTSSCAQPVASTAAMWQRLWRPMTWCPGSSSHMPRLLSSILAHRSLRCHPAFCWRWRKTALRASMTPWNNVHWSPNQFLCFNYHTNTYSDTCKWLHKADDMICQITL